MSRCPIRDDYNPFSPAESYPAGMATLPSIASEDPVFFNTHSNWWSVAGFEELREVLRDTKRFSSADGILHAVSTARSAELAPNGAADECPTLINNDPPAHRRIRKLANQAFTPKAVRSWGPVVEQRVTDLIDNFVDRGHCEFVSEFSEQLPILVIMQILGIPLDQYDNAFRWSESLLMVREPQIAEEARDEQWYWNGHWSAYLEGMIEERRGAPRDDLTSALLEASNPEDPDEEPKLSDEEVRSTISQLLIAGNETTRKLLSSLALRLTEQPDLAARLETEPGLIDKVVEEELRHRSPVRGLFRVATEDVELAGATIRAGDRLHLCFASANHDARTFPEPNTYDPERPNVRDQIGFGRGEHFCIGAPLARLEAKTALRQVAQRLPNLRRTDDGPVPYPNNVIVSGPAKLHLAWDVATA